MVGFGFPCSGGSVSFRERWRRSKVMIGTTRTTSTPWLLLLYQSQSVGMRADPATPHGCPTKVLPVCYPATANHAPTKMSTTHTKQGTCLPLFLLACRAERGKMAWPHKTCRLSDRGRLRSGRASQVPIRMRSSDGSSNSRVACVHEICNRSSCLDAIFIL